MVGTEVDVEGPIILGVLPVASFKLVSRHCQLQKGPRWADISLPVQTRLTLSKMKVVWET